MDVYVCVCVFTESLEVNEAHGLSQGRFHLQSSYF